MKYNWKKESAYNQLGIYFDNFQTPKVSSKFSTSTQRAKVFDINQPYIVHNTISGQTKEFISAQEAQILVESLLKQNQNYSRPRTQKEIEKYGTRPEKISPWGYIRQIHGVLESGREFKAFSINQRLSLEAENKIKGLESSLKRSSIPDRLIDEVKYMLKKMSVGEQISFLSQNQYVEEILGSDQLSVKNNFLDFYETLEVYFEQSHNDNVYKFNDKARELTRQAVQYGNTISEDEINEILKEHQSKR